MRREGTDYGAHMFFVDRILDQPEPFECLRLADGQDTCRADGFDFGHMGGFPPDFRTAKGRGVDEERKP
jgi:hypothetical protein